MVMLSGVSQSCPFAHHPAKEVMAAHSLTSEHYKGVCPHLEALSNEGILPKNGIVTSNQLKQVLGNRFGSTVTSLLVTGASRQLAEGDLDRPFHLKQTEKLSVVHRGALNRRYDNLREIDGAMQAFAKNHPDGCTIKEFARFQSQRLKEEKASPREAAIGWVETALFHLAYNADKTRFSGDTLNALANRKLTPKQRELMSQESKNKIQMWQVTASAVRLRLAACGAKRI